MEFFLYRISSIYLSIYLFSTIMIDSLLFPISSLSHFPPLLPPPLLTKTHRPSSLIPDPSPLIPRKPYPSNLTISFFSARSLYRVRILEFSAGSRSLG